VGDLRMHILDLERPSCPKLLFIKTPSNYHL